MSTVDTDVIVILVGAYFSFLDTFPDMNIFVGFGTGKHFKYYSINSICQSLGKEKSRALPFFHTFTGCDTTSQFLGKGKKSAWESWISYPEVTKAFLFAQEHSFRLLQPQSSQMELLDRYVWILYDRTTAMCLVNELGKELFCKRAKTMDGIPPTQVKFNHGFCYIFHHNYFICCYSVPFYNIQTGPCIKQVFGPYTPEKTQVFHCQKDLVGRGVKTLTGCQYGLCFLR